MTIVAEIIGNGIDIGTEYPSYDSASCLTDIGQYENSSLTKSISIAYTNGASGDKFEDEVKSITTDYGAFTKTVNYDYDELGRRTRIGKRRLR